ncbi:hypothetical protein Ade02nite_94470 [Paractinoplanes deccanensis]|uniref:Uncharacterized protein n=1 Tax=Paractinoplanes deccanensis TaxID=113561 RepID=A0ABQ3YLC6_9ACTN|nr:hypothetical protein [Actinoplanes deccanensis]GID80806.1 hypothetical protein Ade02nite_94470 [Actinoplanes deccanensis]
MNAGKAGAPAVRAWARRLVVVLLAGGSIAALLADLYGVAPMHVVFWLVSVPTMVALAVAGSLPRVDPELRARIRAGAVGGLAGVVGYDVVRVPFALAGQRVFAPIETYGLLIADASSSSPLTSTLGWLYHLSNGVTFGIAYAAVAARRPVLWAVAWGLFLETVALLSPFAERYGISGRPVPIAIAYAAHVFYGWPLGRLVRDLDRTTTALGRRGVAASLTVAVAVVLAWHRPWNAPPGPPPAEQRPATVVGPPADEPVTVVRVDRFDPEWLRIRPGGCAVVDNRSAVGYTDPAGAMPAGVRSPLCFGTAGIYRIRLGTRPYSGGFVYVDGVG